MDWSPQQLDAIEVVRRWLSSNRQLCRVFGFAGTGKTTLAQHLADDMDNVLFGAYTGKAALRLHQKGCLGARTIHSLIYVPNSAAELHAKMLADELKRLEALPAPTLEEQAEVAELKSRLEDARAAIGRCPSFS